MPRQPWTQAVAKICAVPDFDQINQSVEKVTQGLEETQSKLDGIFYEVKHVRRELAQVSDFTGGYKERMLAVERRGDDLLRDYQRIEKAVRECDGHLCRLEGRLDACEAHEQNVQECTAQVVEIKEVLDDLGRTVGGFAKLISSWEWRWRREHARAHVVGLRDTEAPQTGMSRLLRRCGIITIIDLAKQDAGKLYKNAQSVDAKEHLVKEPFDKDDIEACIEEAKAEGKS